MVPQYQPARALEFYRKWLANERFQGLMPYHAHSLVQTKLRGNRICLCHTFVCLAVSLSTGVGELHYAPELAPETVNRSQSSPLGWNFTCPILSDPHLLSAADGQEDAIVVAVPSKPPVADATRYTCAQTRTHAHAHMHTHTHLHIYTHTYTSTHVYTSTKTYTHTCNYAFVSSVDSIYRYAHILIGSECLLSPGTSWPGPSRYIGPAPSHIDGTATTQCARVIPSRYPTCPRYSTHDEIKARCSGAVHENRSIADYVVGLCCKMIRLAGTTW